MTEKEVGMPPGLGRAPTLYPAAPWASLCGEVTLNLTVNTYRASGPKILFHV